MTQRFVMQHHGDHALHSCTAPCFHKSQDFHKIKYIQEEYTSKKQDNTEGAWEHVAMGMHSTQYNTSIIQ